MQNFTINDGSQPRETKPQKSYDTDQLGECIRFINCKGGLLIATPADSTDKIDYLVPVCLGYSK